MGSSVYVGLMSGTSMDGVDAAAVRFPESGGCELLAHHSQPYPAPLRQSLLEASVQLRPVTLAQLSALDTSVGQCFAETLRGLLSQDVVQGLNIAAIGSHGQTVFHAPPNSLQLGDPNLIAAACRYPVVADFRRADLAAGGQGAPLAPAFHLAMFGHPDEARCVLNLGGIANLTVLPADDGPVLGFDTGPANGLLDEWMQQATGQAYDTGGRYAAAGWVHPPLFDALRSDAYFTLDAPKSTGRDYFNLQWCRQRYPQLDALPPQDVACTLTELTASTTARALQESAPDCAAVYVCGGGAQNAFLMERLGGHLPGCRVTSTAELGLAPQWIEAAAFAWLAKRRMESLPGNLPSVTGASRLAVLGAVYRAQERGR